VWRSGGPLAPVLVVVFFSCAAFALTLPAWLSAQPAVPGGFEGPDLVGSAWYWWWTAHALGQGASPFATSHTYFPVVHEPVALFNLCDALLVAPLYWLFQPVQAYCLGVAALLAAVGIAAWKLARWVGASQLAAVFSGLVMMSGSYTLGEIWGGRLAQAFSFFLILSLGLWLRIFRDERPRWPLALAAGLASAATCLTYWYYGFFLGLALLALIAVHGRRWAPARLRQAALAGSIAAACVAPFLWCLLRPGSLLPGLEQNTGWLDHGALAAGEPGLNWALDSGLWLGWLLAPGQGLVGDQSLFAVLALCALAPLVGYRKGRGLWIILALGAWALSLGPYPKDQQGEVLAAIPLPYLWLYRTVPFFDRFWWPYRVLPVLWTALCVLAALNLSDLARDLGRRGRWLPLVAILAWCGESALRGDHFPLGAGPVLTPTPAYAELDGPVLTLPVFGPDAGGRFALWMQLFHEQPILYGDGGQLDGHRPPEMDELVARNPLLAVLKAYEWAPPAAIEVPGSAISELHELGFRYVLLDKAFYQPARAETVVPLLEAFLRQLLGEPHVRDGRVWLWRLPASAQGYRGAPPMPTDAGFMP